MHLHDSLHLEEIDLYGDLEEISEDAFARQSVPGRKRSLEILRKCLRMHLHDSQHLEEIDLSGDLEEISEDAVARQSVPGRK
jgi:hypothetical protein